MEWSRLYANLPDLPPVQAAEYSEPGAFGLLVQSICYCTRAESEGFIPHTQVPRFGGARLRQRVGALLGEKLWAIAEDGYVINPDIWCEERNLSDSAERKRVADRERMRTKRAADRERAEQGDSSATVSRDMSRDRRATGPATRSSDSRTLEKRREEQPPPTPPRPLWPAAVPDAKPEGEGEDPDEENRLAALVAEVRDLRPEWSSTSIRRALTHPDVAERDTGRVRAAMLAVAADPATEQPGRLKHDGPWWATRPASPPPPPRPAWCGECDENTRLTTGDPPARCDACHPLRRAS
jgi:hypothetical protein